MAAGDGFFAPLKWATQNQFIDVFKINGAMHVAIVARGNRGSFTRVQVVLPNGQIRHDHDLEPHGVTHIFGVVAEPSRDTNTWKLACLTFPKGEFGVGERTVYFHDTGIGVDWSQVAG